MTAQYALSSSNVKQESVACLFCLSDLLRGIPPAGVDEDVARLDPCSHTMHSECLQMWVVRANTCPICRAKFNMYSVSKTLDSEVIQTCFVEDKRQAVPEFQLDIGNLGAGQEQQAAVAHYETFHAECTYCHLDGHGEPILCSYCARFYHVQCLEPRRPANVLICRSCALQEERALMNGGNPFSGGSRLQTRPVSRIQLARLVGQEHLVEESARRPLEADHSPWDESDDDDMDGQTASITTGTKRRRTVAPAPTGGLSVFVEPLAWGEPIRRRTRTAWPQGPEVVTEEERELWEAFELALEESRDRRV